VRDKYELQLNILQRSHRRRSHS